MANRYVKGANNFCCIYKITSPSGKIYVGQSMRWNKRLSSYKALNCHGQTKLYNSFKKYGFGSHTIEILQKCEEHELNQLEIYYGELFNCRDPKAGLNIKYFGSNGRMAEETKKKIGLIHKGKKISDWHKKRLSEVNKGKKISQETKDKLAVYYNDPEERVRRSERILGEKNGMWGKVHSDETKRKIGLKSIGRKHSEENKKRAGDRFRGRKMPDEQKSKLAASKRKIILNKITGIFYDGVIEAATSEGILFTTLYSRLNGNLKNNTNFIYT